MNTAPSLPELQRRFADGVLHNPLAALGEWIAGNGLEPEARMRIYHNIVFNNLTAALRTAYPAVLKLVGDAFFESTATLYIRNYPSQSGNLQDYGAHLAELLVRLPEASDLPYLVDVAQLEWARQEAYLAADAVSLNPGTLRTATESAQNLRFTLHPSLRQVVSRYPVLDIWGFCQEEAPGHLQLSDEGQRVAVWREGAQVVMQALDVGRDCCVRCLLAGEPLVAAYDATMQAQADFDLTACLRWLFKAGLVTAFNAP